MLSLQRIGERVNVFHRCIPRTIENRAALRTAIAVLVAVLIAFKLHITTPYWSGMTFVILSNLYTGSIIDKAMMRIAGTIGGAWIGYYIAGYVANSFYLYLLVCFLLIAVAVYYYNVSRYAYAYLLGGITAFIIVAQLAINPGNAFYVAIWRSAEIGLGVIVSAVSAFCLFPNNIKDSFSKRMDTIFTLFSLEIDQLQHFIFDGSTSLDVIIETNLKLKTELKKTTEMMGFMRHEMGVNRGDMDKLRALFDLFYGLARKLNYFVLSQKDEMEGGSIWQEKLPMTVVFNAIQDDLTTLKTAYFAHGRFHMTLLTEHAISTLDTAFMENRHLFSKDTTFYYQIRHLLQQINQMIVSLGALLIDQEMIAASKVNLHSRVARLHNDPDVIKHSIKAGLSVVLAMMIWLFSNWPGGLNGIVSSIAISIRKNIFDMKNISIHRLLGCILGGGSALFILSLVAMEIYSFIISLFFLVWAFSYFSFKYTHYAYIGLQANIALVITLAQEGGPPIYLEPPLERLGGIVIGIVASFIVANLIWRSDALGMLEGRLHKLSRFLVYNMRQLLTLNRKQIIFHDLTNLFWFCRGLFDSLAKENLTRKKQLKLAGFKTLFERSVLIQATIRCIYDSINRDDAYLTAAILDVDLEFCETSINEVYQDKSEANVHMIQQKLDEYLSVIGKTPPNAQVTNEHMINLLAYLNALRQLALNC